MDPPPLNLATEAAVELVPVFHDRDGTSCAIVMAKQRFRVGPGGTVERVDGAEVRLADELWDPDEPSSSIKYPADVCQEKPSTDVIVVGSAIAPGGAPVPSLDVSLRVGAIHKQLRVHGTRAWYDAVGRYELTSPEPFERMPIVWERAFGGADYETDPERPLEEPRNPCGRGLVATPAALAGTEGPNVELPDDGVKNQDSRPAPAGFGAIGRNFAPRRGYAGTYDEQWMEERMPLPPLDFDPRFNQAAPPDQIPSAPLRGGEPVEIVGMHEDGPLRFTLPSLRFFFGVRTDEGFAEHPPQLDTLLLEPNDRVFDLTWRARLPLPRERSRLHYVQVNEKRILS